MLATKSVSAMMIALSTMNVMSVGPRTRPSAPSGAANGVLFGRLVRIAAGCHAAPRIANDSRST
jgi:hypothetical protein